MENVWEYLRGNKLSARVWDSYEAIVEACAEAWNFFVTTQTASARSAPGTGQQSIFGAAGIICEQGQLFKVTKTWVRGHGAYLTVHGCAKSLI